MIIKQKNNSAKPHCKPLNRWLSANLSPPKVPIVKELLCYDVRIYSCQVAPLQSLFPLQSGITNITSIIPIGIKINTSETQCG